METGSRRASTRDSSTHLRLARLQPDHMVTNITDACQHYTQTHRFKFQILSHLSPRWYVNINITVQNINNFKSLSLYKFKHINVQSLQNMQSLKTQNLF